MTQPTKKWVFTELVKDPNNIEQLLSYAVYKGFKDEIARNARAAGKKEQEIEAELTAYHDQCLKSPKQLQVFKKSAQEILDGYVSGVNNELQERLEAIFAQQENIYQNQIKALQKEKEEANKNAIKQLVKGAEKYSKQIKKPVGFWDCSQVYGIAILKFLFSGVPKLFATAFSIGLLFSLYGLFNGDAVTGLRKGLYKVVDITVPGERLDKEHKDVSSTAPKTNEDNSKPQDGGA
ncbi:hypothetical protein LPQ20_20605 [Klebsiella pneumoniae]|uniref:hypothetical protein n=1 Tax=Enterobacter hormaechei TaxID=158836 RepID=UPI003B178A81|nr:hypothetical protein [Salmonella enterica]MCJ7341742.1 hypothetical protein [Klebsiella pneumoniae]